MNESNEDLKERVQKLSKTVEILWKLSILKEEQQNQLHQQFRTTTTDSTTPEKRRRRQEYESENEERQEEDDYEEEESDGDDDFEEIGQKVEQQRISKEEEDVVVVSDVQQALVEQLKLQETKLKQMIESVRRAAKELKIAAKEKEGQRQLKSQYSANSLHSYSLTSLLITGERRFERRSQQRIWSASERQREILTKMYQSRFACVSASHDLKGSIVDARFDPTGNRPLIVAASTDGGSNERTSAAPTAGYTAILYNYLSGESFPLQAHAGSTVAEVAFSQDGQTVFTGGYDGTLGIWDVSSFPILDSSFIGEKRRVQRFQISRSNPEILAIITDGQNDKNVIIYTVNHVSKEKNGILRSGTMCNELDWGSGNFGNVIVCACDNKKAIACVNGVLEEYRHTADVNTVSCSLSNEIFLTGDTAGVMSIWDFHEKRTPAIVFPSTKSPLNSTTFSPCGRFIQGSTERNSVHIFDIRKPAIPLHVLQHNIPPHSNGDGFGGGNDDGTIFAQGIYMSRWSKSGLLLSCGEDNTLKIWDVRRGDPLIATSYAHKDAVTCGSFSPDETLVVSGCDGHRVALHSLTSEDAAGLQRRNHDERQDLFAGQAGHLLLPRSFVAPLSIPHSNNDVPMVQI